MPTRFAPEGMGPSFILSIATSLRVTVAIRTPTTPRFCRDVNLNNGASPGNGQHMHSFASSGYIHVHWVVGATPGREEGMHNERAANVQEV